MSIYSSGPTGLQLRFTLLRYSISLETTTSLFSLSKARVYYVPARPCQLIAIYFMFHILTIPYILSVTDYRHSRSSPGRLQDGVNATLYIDRRSILLADHCSHFSYLLPHYTLLPPPSSCIYRGFRATFTIKSFMHFHTLQKLT